MGRPPINPADRRAKTITMRATENDKKALERDAKKAKLSISDYLYHCWQIVRNKK